MEKNLIVSGIYGWGVGYYNSDMKIIFERMVDNFCNKHKLELKEKSSSLSAQSVNGVSQKNYIYFHPMEIVFKGKYANEKLINDFILTLTDEIPYANVDKILEK